MKSRRFTERGLMCSISFENLNYKLQFFRLQINSIGKGLHMSGFHYFEFIRVIHKAGNLTIITLGIQTLYRFKHHVVWNIPVIFSRR